MVVGMVLLNQRIVPFAQDSTGGRISNHGANRTPTFIKGLPSEKDCQTHQ